MEPPGERDVYKRQAVIDAHLVDSVVIPRIHPQVIQAISLSTAPDGVNAVGVMEFFSVTAAVYAADAAAKAADVTLLDVRLGVGIGGKSFAVLTGEVAAVEEAVRCGMAAGEEKGLAVTSTVIPSPRKEIFEDVYKRQAFDGALRYCKSAGADNTAEAVGETAAGGGGCGESRV